VNQQFRLQKFQPAVPGPAGTCDDLSVLARLVAAVGGAAVSGELHALWRELAATVPILQGVSYATLSDAGLALDAAAFAGLPFVEGETLHYQPAAKK
jgi:NADH-quinone oxidoreductase subunit G